MSGSQEVMAVAEIERRYPNEWVLVEIVRDHKHHEKIRGRLIAHSPRRDDMLEPDRAFRLDHPNAILYTLYTGDIVPADRDFVVVL